MSDQDLLFALVVVLLGIEAIFSGTEIAFLSLKPHLFHKKYDTFTKNLEEIILATVIGTNIAVVLNSTIVSYIIKTKTHLSSELLTTLILSPCVLIFGETIPKVIARKNPTKFLKFSFPLFKFFYIISYPVRVIILFLPKRFGIKIEKPSSISREEIPLIVDDEEQQYLVKRIVNLRKRRVKNSMKPIRDIFAVDRESSVGEVIKLAEKIGYSRFPIYSNHIYNIEGIVWIFDLIDADRNESISNFVRDCPFISELQSIHSAIKTFKIAKSPIAIVVNEYGLSTGILTIEDVFEELVGEIEDEYDLYSKKVEIVEKRGKSIVFSGETDIHILESELKIELPKSELFKTLSGFIIYNFDRIPKEREVLQFRNIVFKILKVSKGKIDLVEVSRTDDS